MLGSGVQRQCLACHDNLHVLPTPTASLRHDAAPAEQPAPWLLHPLVPVRTGRNGSNFWSTGGAEREWKSYQNGQWWGDLFQTWYCRMTFFSSAFPVKLFAVLPCACVCVCVCVCGGGWLKVKGIISFFPILLNKDVGIAVQEEGTRMQCGDAIQQ